MGDAAASGAGGTRRDGDVERSRHPLGSLTRDGSPTSAPRPSVLTAGAPAAHAVWVREVLATPDLLEFYPRTALPLIHLGGLTQAPAARKLAISPAQLANHVAPGLHRVAALLTGWGGHITSGAGHPRSQGPGVRS